MFKKFDPSEDVGTLNQVKTSVVRNIKNSLRTTYPYLEESGLLEFLLPKKEPIQIAKLSAHLELLVCNKTPLFFKERDMPWCPTLRLVHQYPQMIPRLRVDKGAIKFVLSGAHIMTPGLTSAGATLHDDVDAGASVSIYGEEKEYAMAIGVTKMSTSDMKSINKGVAVDNVHYLNDGLWKNNKVD